MIKGIIEVGISSLIGIGVYEGISQNEIIENDYNDLIIKMIIAIVSAVLIPFLNDLRKIVIKKISKGDNPKGNSDQIINNKIVRYPALGKKQKDNNK